MVGTVHKQLYHCSVVTPLVSRLLSSLQSWQPTHMRQCRRLAPQKPSCDLRCRSYLGTAPGKIPTMLPTMNNWKGFNNGLCQPMFSCNHHTCTQDLREAKHHDNPNQHVKPEGNFAVQPGIASSAFNNTSIQWGFGKRTSN